MKIRIIRDLRGLLEAREGWDKLLSSGGQNMPFYSWAWYSTWWKHFGGNGDLFLLVAEEPYGCFQGIAPLFRRWTRLRGLPVRELRFLDNGIGPRNAIILQQGAQGIQALRGMLECINDHRAEWDLLTLSNIDAESGYLNEFVEFSKSLGFRVLTEPGRQSPCIRLAGNFEDYWVSTVNSKLRGNILRAIRMQSKRGLCDVRDYHEIGEMDTALKLAFQVSGNSWKGRTGSDMAGSPARAAFYREITILLAEQRQVRVWLLSLDGRPVALAYLIKSDHACHLLVSDFDDHFRDLSPGHTLIYHIVKSLFEEGVEGLDLGGNAYDYKKRWAQGIKEHVHLQLFNANYYSSFIGAAKIRVLPAIRSAISTLMLKNKP